MISCTRCSIGMQAGVAAAFAAVRATLRSAPTLEALLERRTADGQETNRDGHASGHVAQGRVSLLPTVMLEMPRSPATARHAAAPRVDLASTADDSSMDVIADAAAALVYCCSSSTPGSRA